MVTHESVRETMEKTKAIYIGTVAGLRELGWPEVADALEREQHVLFGNPETQPPAGIMVAPEPPVIRARTIPRVRIGKPVLL